MASFVSAQSRSRWARVIAATAAGLAGLALAGPAQASSAAPGAAGAAGAHQLRSRVVLNGATLWHRYRRTGSSAWHTESLAQPDDLTVLGRHLFTAFQNGVGPQGQASSDGNRDSTVVEFTAAGKVVRQWDLRGHCDGLTADARLGAIMATVNEDAHSSLSLIKPESRPGHQVVHYRYNRSPLPHNGGTDAISVYHGQILVSASAPGTTGKPAPQPSYPAVYRVTLHRAHRVAAVRPVFFDEALARVANAGPAHGKLTRLALTDPDSNEIVPASARRFAGDFVLDSQGDKEQIFLQPGDGRAGPRLWVLHLSQSIDDSAWARSRLGTLYAANTDGDTVDVVTGAFQPGSVFVAVTPCDAANAPATCPAPGFPPGYLGQLNPWTGQVTRVSLAGPGMQPHGMVFVAPGWNVTPG